MASIDPAWSRPAYLLLERALWEYVAGLSPEERRRIEEAAALLLGRRPGSGGEEDQG